MFSKRDLRRHIEENSAGATFIKFEYTSTEKFSIEVKSKVDKDQTPEYYSQLSTDWIKKFAKFTATTWIVRSCFAKLKRLLYRKIYVCHRSSYNKKKKPDSTTRNQDCRARVEFRMKFINRNTIKNDPLLKEGLNLTISIDFSHSHTVRGPESFNLLKSTPETDNIFQMYFDKGCSPTAAMAYHELILIDEYGSECPEILSNATINPSLRHVFYLHDKRRKEGVENRSFQEIMDFKKANLEMEGFNISFLINPEIITIISPSMKRTIEEFGMDHVIVDSTQVLSGPIVTYYYIPSKIGALPIACVIHTKQNQEDYLQAFYTVKLALEFEFNKNLEPKICILNNFEEQTPISTLYQAKLKSSRYSISSELWCLMINDEENKVERKKRHGIMAAFKSLLYAENPDDAEKAYEELKENQSVKSTPKLKEYLDRLWTTRDKWIDFGEENQCKGLVEVSIRFIKEFLVRRCKSFNNLIMVDVVAKIFENHQCSILVSHLKGTKVISTYTKYLTKANISLGFGSNVRRIAANDFKIEYLPRKHLRLRTDTMCCECVHGKKGQFCEHLCAIINFLDTDIMKLPKLTDEEKISFIKLVGHIDVERKTIKPEVKDLKNDDDKDDIDIHFSEETNDAAYHYDEPESAASSPKSDNDYLDLEVKSERCDPLEEESDNMQEEEAEIEYLTTENTVADTTNTSQNTDMVTKYETALKAVNDEFRRLNRYFSENANSTNLETMTRLARELRKIRPIERINLEHMHIKLNGNGKRKRSK